MTGIELQLPWPPTMNTYWRSVPKKRGRKVIVQVLISAAGRAYRVKVAQQVLAQIGKASHLDGRLAIDITALPPDRRVRDLDNLFKGTLDALTKAGVWTDDGNLDRITIERGPIQKGGALLVRIQTYTPSEAP